MTENENSNSGEPFQASLVTHASNAHFCAPLHIRGPTLVLSVHGFAPTMLLPHPFHGGPSMRNFLLLVALVAITSVSSAQSAKPTLYIQPTEDGFQTYITAAIHKKKVPVTVVTSPENATYMLATAEVEVEKVTTGRKLVNCLFAYCGGNEDKASTSVQMTDPSGAVVWSYAVNKGRGSKNRQSMAEAIAKHLKEHLGSSATAKQ
jgi:hypothetical protein